MPVQFDSLSLWLDASDSILDKAPYTLWVDADDTSTIVTDAGTNELVSWANKTDPAIKLHSGAHRPNSGASINGLNAINFDYSPNKEQIFAKKNGTIDWNPAGVNGATTGTVSDIAVFMALQADTLQRTNMPFNFGWGDHFPWSNGHIYWHFSDNRKSTSLFTANTPLVVCLYFSVSEQTQTVFKNGNQALTGPRTTETNIGGRFFFPNTSWSPDYTVGEIIVRNGILPISERQLIEGYLTHKWGLDGELPASHPFKNGAVGNLVHGFWKDKSSNQNHAVTMGSPTLIANQQNSLPVMRYDGSQPDYHEWDDIEDIRTVFSVIRRNSSSSTYGGLLADDDRHDFFANSANILHADHADENLLQGLIRLNGTNGSAGSTSFTDSQFDIVSVRSTDTVEASRIGKDRSMSDSLHHFDGDYAELLIYNRALSDAEIQKVEGYLAHKWGLDGNLDASHPFKTQPLVTVGQKFSYDGNFSIENFRFDFLSHEKVYDESSLLSRWRFNEEVELGDQSIIKDMGVGRNDGYIRGNSQLQSGKFGLALSLDGDGDYLEIPRFRGHS